MLSETSFVGAEAAGDFGTDNRAGLERTLHRISCIRNRAGRIVGLTCRVGRVRLLCSSDRVAWLGSRLAALARPDKSPNPQAPPGTPCPPPLPFPSPAFRCSVESPRLIGYCARGVQAVEGSAVLVEDVAYSGASILLLGRPGVGKTTAIRELARLLSEPSARNPSPRRRVVIVDTSNEIGGDGNVPHPGIGLARRMQVGSVAQQHRVMIEAVENHMPEVRRSTRSRNLPCPTQRTHATGLWVARWCPFSAKDPL
jgi:hypothetical protein